MKRSFQLYSILAVAVLLTSTRAFAQELPEEFQDGSLVAVATWPDDVYVLADSTSWLQIIYEDIHDIDGVLAEDTLFSQKYMQDLLRKVKVQTIRYDMSGGQRHQTRMSVTAIEGTNQYSLLIYDNSDPEQDRWEPIVITFGGTIHRYDFQD